MGGALGGAQGAGEGRERQATTRPPAATIQHSRAALAALGERTVLPLRLTSIRRIEVNPPKLVPNSLLQLQPPVAERQRCMP